MTTRETPDDETLRAMIAGTQHGPVHITADRCEGDSRAVNAFCDLVRAAPALAAEVLRLRAVRDAAQEYVEQMSTEGAEAAWRCSDAAGEAWVALRKAVAR